MIKQWLLFILCIYFGVLLFTSFLNSFFAINCNNKTLYRDLIFPTKVIACWLRKEV